MRTVHLPNSVQKLVHRRDGVGEIDDYEAAAAAEKQLTQELFEQGYVVRYDTAEDGDGGTYTAIRTKDAR